MTETLSPPTPPLKQPKDLHERDRRFRLKFPPGPRAQQWMIVLLLITAFVSLIVKGANGPADPSFRTARRVPLPGFGEIAYRVSGTEQGTRCALLAQTAQQQAQGLMNQRDLAGYDGMLFAFPADTSTAFFMKDTPLPLTIAWFDTGGRLIGSTDMEPCLDRADCPIHAAPRPFRYALEVPKGGLATLSIGAGSVISVGGPCE
ncbi:MAG: DUF192 domain-containing protein [Acidimicrobiales bacterium]